MRFNVVLIVKGFGILDSKKGIIVSLFNDQKTADKVAAEMNTSSVPVPKERLWDIVSPDRLNTLEYLLDIGYDPYGVDSGKHYLKRPAIVD